MNLTLRQAFEWQASPFPALTVAGGQQTLWHIGYNDADEGKMTASNQVYSRIRERMKEHAQEHSHTRDDVDKCSIS